MRIIQLETAVGAAMKNFEGAHGKSEGWCRVIFVNSTPPPLLPANRILSESQAHYLFLWLNLLRPLSACIGINVPRRRFLPVKTCSDLLLVMSNLYDMKHGRLEMSPLRQFPSVPIVQLSGGYFKKVRGQKFILESPSAFFQSLDTYRYHFVVSLFCSQFQQSVSVIF